MHLRKLADDTKLGVPDPAEGCAATWRDLSRLGNQADRNFLKFNKEKYNFLHMRRNVYHSVLGPPSWIKDLGL